MFWLGLVIGEITGSIITLIVMCMFIVGKESESCKCE